MGLRTMGAVVGSEDMELPWGCDDFVALPCDGHETAMELPWLHGAATHGTVVELQRSCHFHDSIVAYLHGMPCKCRYGAFMATQWAPRPFMELAGHRFHGTSMAFS